MEIIHKGILNSNITLKKELLFVIAKTYSLVNNDLEYALIKVINSDKGGYILIRKPCLDEYRSGFRHSSIIDFEFNSEKGFYIFVKRVLTIQDADVEVNKIIEQLTKWGINYAKV